MNDIDLLAAHERLLTLARDLLRANKRYQDIAQLLVELEKTLAAFSESEFDDWCLDVDQLAMSKFVGQPTHPERWRNWDYSGHFAQGLTTDEAAENLKSHLLNY